MPLVPPISLPLQKPGAEITQALIHRKMEAAPLVSG